MLSPSRGTAARNFFRAKPLRVQRLTCARLKFFDTGFQFPDPPFERVDAPRSGLRRRTDRWIGRQRQGWLERSGHWALRTATTE